MGTSSVMLDNADLLVSAAGIEQAWQDLNQAISDGDVIAAIAGVSVLAAFMRKESMPASQGFFKGGQVNGFKRRNATKNLRHERAARAR